MRSKIINHLLVLLVVTLFVSCKGNQVIHYDHLKAQFLSEYILPEDTFLGGTQVGGLSGIDFSNGTYYLICDDEDTPRFYEATIDISNNQISKVNINKVVLLKDSLDVLDMESIRYHPKNNQVLLTSEGAINDGVDPLFISVDLKGNVVERFAIPESFRANNPQGPRHNATLEGLCNSYDNKGYWLGMELPLKADGLEPTVNKTTSPVRITYIGNHSKKAEKQFGYLLDPIAKKPKGSFSINGLTDLIEYEPNIFFTIERSYSSGLGNQGNTIRLFKVDASQATNTLDINSLKNTDFIPAKKTLLFDFETVRNQLTDHSVDNIEGITLGPKLPNGHETLILVSDNNFNKLGKQLNQFILLEILP